MEVGKLVVAKHPNPHTLLSPYVLLILGSSDQVSKGPPSCAEIAFADPQRQTIVS